MPLAASRLPCLRAHLYRTPRRLESALVSVLTETLTASTSCYGNCSAFTYADLYSTSNTNLGWNLTSAGVIGSDPCSWPGVTCAPSGPCNVIPALDFTNVNMGCPGVGPCTTGRAAFPKAFSGLTSLASLRFVMTHLSPYFYTPATTVLANPQNLLLRPEYNSGVKLTTLYADSPLGPVASSVSPMVLSDDFFVAQTQLTSFTCRTCYLRGSFPSSVTFRGNWTVFDISVPVAQVQAGAGYVAMCGTLYEFPTAPMLFNASGHCFNNVPDANSTANSTQCLGGGCTVASSTYCNQLLAYNTSSFQYTAIQQRSDCTSVCSTSCTSPQQPDPFTCGCGCPLSVQLGCAGTFNPSTCQCTCGSCSDGTLSSTCECACRTSCPVGLVQNPDCSCGVIAIPSQIANLNTSVSGQSNGTFFVFPTQVNGERATLGVSVAFGGVFEVTSAGADVARFPLDQLTTYGFTSRQETVYDASNNPVSSFVTNSKLRKGSNLTVEVQN